MTRPWARFGRSLALVATVAGLAAALTVRAAPQQQPAASPPQGSASQPPVFRGGTALVPVDVRVVDKDGRPVTDLVQGDFTVLENGRPQQIRLFAKELLTAEPPPPAGAGAGLVRNAGRDLAPAPQSYRVYLIVLGRGRLQNVAKGTDGILHLVNDVLLPQDRVAVLAWNRATDFTTDHGRVASVLQRFKQANNKIESQLQQYFSGLVWLYGNHQIPDYIQREIDDVFGGPANAGNMRTIPGATGPDSAATAEDTQRTIDMFQAPSADAMNQQLQANSGLSFDQFIQASAQTGQDINNLYTGINYLREIEGEKHLLWLTETGLLTQRVDTEATLARTAADARVVIDIIRTAGTQLSSGLSAENRRAPSPGAENRTAMNSLQPSATSRTLADVTGGRYDANRFANASVDVEVIERASRSQYLLGYYPTNATLDNRFRTITVRVNRPDLTLMYRHGYYALADVAPMNAKDALTYNRITGAASYAKDIPDIRLQVKAGRPDPQTGAVEVSVTVDIARVGFQKQGAQNVATLQLAAFCLDKNGRTVGNLWKSMDLSLTDDRRRVLTQSGVPITLSIPATTATQHVKVVAYDYNQDLVGSSTVAVGP